MKPENPFSFFTKKEHNSFLVEYDSLYEIGQGGPVIGSLSINLFKLKGKFGGPIHFLGNYGFAPFFVESFFDRGFKFAVIDLISLEVTLLGSTHMLMNILSVGQQGAIVQIDFTKGTTIMLQLPNTVVI